MKPSSLYFLLVGGTALISYAAANLGFAQPVPQPPAAPITVPPPPPGTGAPFYDLQQLPETRGTLQRFTLTPRGDLDGFLLADGMQIHVPPHLTAELAAALRPGDPISVRGYRLPNVPLVVAAEVSDLTTNQTVVDRGPPPPGSRPLPPPAPGAWQPTTLSGKVQTPLYGPAGDITGALLGDGTIIRLPPPVAAQSPSLLAPGQTVAVQGFALGTAYGRVIEAQTVEPAPATTPTYPPPGTGAPLRP